jgi:hypothetical protein
LSRQYQFINLSLGPDLPIEDTEVHAWTSVIDDLLSDGETLMTVAVGNNGEMDRESGNARIQVPSDCVNALAVGACDTVNETGMDKTRQYIQRLESGTAVPTPELANKLAAVLLVMPHFLKSNGSLL